MNNEQKPMELKDLILKVLKFWPVFVIFTILGVLGGFVFDKFQTPVYKTQVSVYFTPTQSQFLSIGAGEFTDMILGVLAGQNLSDGAVVKTRKVAPQIIEFTISAAEIEVVAQSAKNLPQRLAGIVNEVLGGEQVSVKVLNPEKEILPPPNFLVLSFAVGGFLGLAAGVSLAAIIIYFKS